MFAGSLKQMDLSEVLKLLTASHQTGVLNLMNPEVGSTVAMIYLQVGQLVHAQVGSSTGLDAISESCRLSEEAFAFEENVMASQQTLSAYPTVKLLEKMSGQISEAKALRLAMPAENEVPVYLPGASLAGLDATADDLSLLILCNGTRTISDLAHDSRRTLLETAKAIAKFRKAGIIDIKAAVRQVSAPEPAKDVRAEGPAATAAEGEDKKIVRYWRGKPVYE